MEFHEKRWSRGGGLEEKRMNTWK